MLPRLPDTIQFLNRAFASLRGEKTPEALLYAINQPEPEPQVTTTVVQASIHEQQLEHFEVRDWRAHFSGQLAGHGLEIGPLHRPLEKHAKMQVDYIDRCSVAELREHYPELRSLPLVEPTIIGDAETMAGIPDRRYDFLVAAHVLEHMRNPIASLLAWVRILRPGGKLYLILPDKRMIFDRRRPRTTLEHLILDYRQPSLDRDFEHFLEYAHFVHGKNGAEAITEAERLRVTDYSIHFHVFLPSDVTQLLQWINKELRPVRIAEGPVMTPGSDEFHFLVEAV